MNNATITIQRVYDAELLTRWRMTVLRCVFSIPEDADMSALELSTRRYYRQHVPDGSHVACIACAGDEAVGCGGLCLYDEMPSPDNPDGLCAYLMNIYVSPAFRGRGIARQLTTWLVEHARARGAAKIYLESSDMARSLYAELGFSDMKDMMKLASDHH